MRIVIDMQGLQTGSKNRGIGRYTKGIVRGLLQCNRLHEIFLIINGWDDISRAEIEREFSKYLSKDRFITWYGAEPTKWNGGTSKNRRYSEILYQYKILEYCPDVFLACSVIEGMEYEFSMSVDILKRYCVVAAVMHDFIPDKNESYLKNKKFSDYYYYYYYDKIKHFDILFANSEYTAEKTRERFGDKVVINISSSSDILDTTVGCSVPRVGNKGKYIFYAGGVDERKNIPCLFHAYSKLPGSIKSELKLKICAGKNKHDLVRVAKEAGIDGDSIEILGFVSDRELISLYSNCFLFVFPSYDEGFGLPVLEAMKCGAPVLCSNQTSLPEVIGLPEATFNPVDFHDLTEKITRCIVDERWYSNLKTHCLKQGSLFSWELTANRFLDFDYSELLHNKCRFDLSCLLQFISNDLFSEGVEDDNDLRYVSRLIVKNFDKSILV